MRTIACKCGKTYQFNERLAGRSVRCRGCGELLAVYHRPVAATMATPPAVDADGSTPVPGASAADGRSTKSQTQQPTPGAKSRGGGQRIAEREPERTVPYSDPLAEAEKASAERHSSQQPAREYQNQGRYRLVRAFARGGMGKVSVARDLALKRDVALKQLLDQTADLPGSERRFLAEAEITGQLEHPGVVPIYGLGTDEQGKPFYAMRLIEGQTLRQAIDDYHKSPRPAELKSLLRRFVMV